MVLRFFSWSYLEVFWHGWNQSARTSTFNTSLRAVFLHGCVYVCWDAENNVAWLIYATVVVCWIFPTIARFSVMVFVFDVYKMCRDFCIEIGFYWTICNNHRQYASIYIAYMVYSRYGQTNARTPHIFAMMSSRGLCERSMRSRTKRERSSCRPTRTENISIAQRDSERSRSRLGWRRTLAVCASAVTYAGWGGPLFGSFLGVCCVCAF